MQLSLDDYASNLLYQIDPEFAKALKKSILGVHPSKKFRAIALDRESYILAIGKNAVVQAKALYDQNKDMITGMSIHQIEGYSNLTIDASSVDIYQVSHPFPSDETFASTKKTLEKLQQLDSSIDIHLLVSGGGSAAFALPEEGVYTSAYLEILRLAIASGYDIEELNLIRSLIDQVKGGKLASKLPEHNIFAWIISDVITDDPRIVASGPVSPGIKIDPSIVNWLERLFLSLEVEIDTKDLIEKLPDKNQEHVKTEIILKRSDFLSLIQSEIEKLDYQVFVADTNLEGDVTEVANQVVQILDQFKPFNRRVIIWSGEPTITLSSQALHDGSGGRISALATLVSKKIKDENIYFLGFATDGKDGSSPAAGYIIDRQTYSRIEDMGTPQSIVTSGNSGLALTSTGHGIHLKYSDINLLDLYLLIIK